MAARAVAKRPVLPRPAASNGNGSNGDAGIDVIRLVAAEGEPVRVTLFYIGDTGYTIPAEPDMSVGLQYTHLAATEGDTVAIDYLLGELLGEDGYAALRGFRGLTTADFTKIVTIATRLTLGTLELPKDALNG